MQKVRVLPDEPKSEAPADPEAGTSALVPLHLASIDELTSKSQAAPNTADRYGGNARAHATKHAYRSDWTHSRDW